MSTCCGPTAFLQTELALSRGNEAGVILAWDGGRGGIVAADEFRASEPSQAAPLPHEAGSPWVPALSPGTVAFLQLGTPGPRIFLVPSASVLAVHILLYAASQERLSNVRTGRTAWRAC